MRKIILDLAVTLDGYIEGPNGETDWCIMDEDMKFEEFLSGIDAIFYGRVSYDFWGNFQPEPASDEMEKNLWRQVHSKKKYVFSSQHRQDDDATFISSNLPAAVAEIKNSEGKDIWLYGGAGLITSFIEHDLIDLYRLSVHPLAMGKGKPLFENIKERIDLKLVKSVSFQSGVIQLIYKPKTNKGDH